jgi:hypothetical protein
MYEVTEKSTVHGYGTPTGYRTPHRLPTDGEDSQTVTFIGLTKQLYPTGRAFYIPERGTFEKLHKGLNTSMIRSVQSAKGTINAALPDNDEFTDQDATLLESKYGLFINPATSLTNRKKAILRKMAYPSNIPARQNRVFLEDQLRLAGFDIRLYENKFLEGGAYVTKTPDEVAALSTTATQHGGTSQHGAGTQHGSSGFNVIANADRGPESYNIGGDTNLWATFFIGGDNLGDMATVPQEREKEFRELVLKLKPAHTVAYLFIKFI